MRQLLLIVLTLCSFIAVSQTKKEEKPKPAAKEKKPQEKRARTPDSLYFSKYNSSIIVGYYGSTKGYNVDMVQYLTKDTLRKSNLNYIGESNWVDGIEISYDKLSLSFGYKSTPPKDKDKKGETKFLNFGFNIGGNKWIVEGSYRRYQGFYEKNTLNYDTTFRQTGKFYNDPSLRSTLHKVKFLYFSNHKRFAFKSCYGSSYRQIKSSFTWIVTANAYYNTLKGDSSIIPQPVRSYYGDQAGLRNLNVFGFSIYGGASLNLVLWKHLLINTTFMLGPEDQFRTYRYDSLPTRDLNYINFTGDVRAAIGLNYRKFYTFVSFIGDIMPYKSGQMEIKSTYYSVNFTMGFRVHTGYPKFYQKFQRTKLYQLM